MKNVAIKQNEIDKIMYFLQYIIFINLWIYGYLLIFFYGFILQPCGNILTTYTTVTGRNIRFVISCKSITLRLFSL